MLGELVRVPKHRATAGALIRPGQSSQAIPFKDDLVKFIAAADRASERDVRADHTGNRANANDSLPIVGRHYAQQWPGGTRLYRGLTHADGGPPAVII